MKKLGFLIVLVTFLCSGMLFAAPGGVDNGLRLWFDASQLNLQDNDPVASWTDVSGNNHHATQATVANQPVYKTDVLNGKSVVRFGGSADMSTGAVFNLGQANEIIVVWKTNTTGTRFAVDGVGNSNRHAIFQGTGGGANIASFAGSTISYNRTTPFDWIVNTAKFDGANSRLFQNGVEMVSGTTGAHSLTGIIIGSRLGNTTMRLNGDIAEIIVYDRALTATEMIEIENYLYGKYGIAVAHIISDDHFVNDFAIMGQKGTLAKTLDAVSGGLVVAGDDASISAEDILMISHNGDNGVTLDNLPAETVLRLRRSWFIDIMGSIDATITFNLPDLGLGHIIPDGDEYVLLYRDDEADDFVVVNSDPIVDSVNQEISFIVEFSDGRAVGTGYYTLGTDDNAVSTLPVELSSFTAILTADLKVEVKWTSESETNMLGYHIYRAESNNLTDASRISGGIIPASNTSETKHYSYVDEEVAEGNRYYYWLQANNLDLTAEFYGSASVFVEYQGGSGSTPDAELVTKLQGTYPNPFNPSTTIMFSVADQPANVTIEVFNSRGQLMQTLISNVQFGIGSHSVLWDGRDNQGRTASSGVYFYKMTTDEGFEMAKKMILMK